MAILISDYKVMRALLEHKYDPKLIALAIWCSVRWSKFRITSAFRKDDPGVHGVFRGLDAESHFAPDPQKLADDANKVWQYDLERPGMVCVLFHDVRQGEHFHLQTHPRTVYLGGKNG